MDRRDFIFTTSTAACGILARPLFAADNMARIQGDIGKSGAYLDRRIYGQNLEVMGRQFEGGIIAEQGSRAPQYGSGFRADVRDALKELGITHLRWPGGCFADAYNWRDGIGESRPSYPNPMWGGSMFRMYSLALTGRSIPFGGMVDNRFGTHEFMEYCRELGAEPSITASLGPETPDEAAAWVAYVRDNFGADAVPVWSVGNEQWNPLERNGCFLKPERYVGRFHEWAGSMRRENPSIRLVASGGDEVTQAGWNRAIVEGIGSEMDYISYHSYLPYPGFTSANIPKTESAYLALMAAYIHIDEMLDCGAESTAAVLGKPVPVSLDEWNILGAAMKFIMPHKSLREAVAAAGVIHAIHRHADLVRLADMFAAVNAGAPPVITDRDNMARTPMYHVLRLYSKHSLSNVSPVKITSPLFSSPRLGSLPARQNVPFIDASLTTDGGKASLFLINRHPRDNMEVKVEIEGIKPGTDAIQDVVTGPSIMSSNPTGGEETVKPLSKRIDWPEKLALPPCSVSVLATA